MYEIVLFLYCQHFLYDYTYMIDTGCRRESGCSTWGLKAACDYGTEVEQDSDAEKI